MHLNSLHTIVYNGQQLSVPSYAFRIYHYQLNLSHFRWRNAPSLPSFPCKIRYPKLRPITLFFCTTAHNLQVSSTWLSWAMQWSEDRMSIFAGNIQFDALKHACRSRRIGNEEAKFAILKVLNWIEFHAHCASMKHLFWFFYWKIFKWKGKSNATSNMQNEMKAPNDLQMFLIECFSSSQASMFHLFTVLFHWIRFFFQVDYKTRFILQVSNIYLVIPFNFVFVSKQTLNEKCKLKILRKTKRKFASIQIWNEREERAIDRDWAKDKTKNSKSKSNNQTDQSLANELKKKRKENSNQTKRRRNI